MYQLLLWPTEHCRWPLIEIDKFLCPDRDTALSVYYLITNDASGLKIIRIFCLSHCNSYIHNTQWPAVSASC